MRRAPPLLVVASTIFISARAADSDPRVITDVAYLTPGRSEKLDVYLPAPPATGKLSPAVVWIHGGGWTGGGKGEGRAREICGAFAGAGYVAVSIDYKLGKGAWPTNLFDCKNAVRFLRAHAAEYHIDPDRIGVSGGSAGGHLALMVGLTAGRKELEPAGAATLYPELSSSVRCVIDLYGPANLLAREETDAKGKPTGRRKPGGSLEVFGAKTIDDDVFRLASPTAHVAKNSPPVLIFHGTIDGTVDLDQSRGLAAGLADRGVPHDLVLVEGAGHAFDFETWQKKPLSRDLRPVALAFLAKYLGPN